MESITAALSADSYIMSCHVKAFPCLATGQGIVAAGLALHQQISEDPDRLKEITVAIADTPSLQRQKDDPGRIDPQSREAADHSFNFLAAVALIDGKFGLHSFDNDRWNDAKVRAVMARLSVVCDASLNGRSPGAFPCAIRATGSDGRSYLAEVLDPPGFSRKGIDQQAVLGKFHSITEGRLGAGSRQRIIDAAMSLEKSASCADLMAAVATASKT
jgi:2-methylcitrate dehydratase